MEWQLDINDGVTKALDAGATRLDIETQINVAFNLRQQATARGLFGEALKVGDMVRSKPGAGQPQIEGTIAIIERDKAFVHTIQGGRWRSLKNLSRETERP